MESIHEISKRLKDRILNASIENPFDEKDVSQHLSWWLDDIFKCVTNINETSLDKFDRVQRLIQLEEKFGIPKTHLILKH